MDDSSTLSLYLAESKAVNRWLIRLAQNVTEGAITGGAFAFSLILCANDYPVLAIIGAIILMATCLRTIFDRKRCLLPGDKIWFRLTGILICWVSWGIFGAPIYVPQANQSLQAASLLNDGLLTFVCANIIYLGIRCRHLVPGLRD